ncbi:MAG: hypothetical protein AB7G21_07135 [Dehalococcoidia bacterium]
MTTAISLPRALRRFALAALPALALLLMPGSLRAADSTALAGDVRGLEICPQVWCGAAVFVGRFDGALDGATGEGRWWVAVRHEALPLLPGTSAPITGGEWGMVVGERPLRGVVTSGEIVNNGDGTFTVRPRLDVVTGGEGRLSLAILLDHGLFPPAVQGAVATGEVELPAPARTPAPTPVAPA